MLIIGLGHKRRVGKDLMANILFSTLRINTKYKVARESFAYKLKQVCHELYFWAGVQESVYYDNYPQDKEKFLPKLGMSVRELWIEYANRVRETFPTTWRDYVLEKVSKDLDILIISDMRYSNEADRIKELGGICIKINRPNVYKHTDLADTGLDGWDKWDHIIENDGTLEEFTTKIFTFEKFIEGKLNGGR